MPLCRRVVGRVCDSLQSHRPIGGISFGFAQAAGARPVFAVAPCGMERACAVPIDRCLSYQTRLHANDARMPPSALVISSECGTRTVRQVAVGAPHPRVSCDQWHVWCTERYMKISYIDRDTMHHAPPLFALRTCSGLFQSTPHVFTSKQTVLPSSMHVSPKRFQRSSRQLGHHTTLAPHTVRRHRRTRHSEQNLPSVAPDARRRRYRSAPAALTRARQSSASLTGLVAIIFFSLVKLLPPRELMSPFFFFAFVL